MAFKSPAPIIVKDWLLKDPVQLVLTMRKKVAWTETLCVQFAYGASQQADEMKTS